MSTMLDPNERYMTYALREAERAMEQGEVPVGCVIVHKGEIIAKAHNQRETLQDPTAHAEVIAITAAAARLGSWRLEDTQMYVTLEPCAMCAGAISHARIGRVVWAADDPKGGAVVHGPRLFEQPTLHSRPTTEGGLLADKSAALLRGFFHERRGGTAVPPVR